jgi:hypothetical protein
VPVLIVGIDYSRKTVFIAKRVSPSGNHETEAKEIFDYCRKNFMGRHPEKQ